RHRQVQYETCFNGVSIGMSRTLHVSGNEQNRDTGWHRDPTPKTTLLSVQLLLVNLRECHWFYGYEYLSQYRNHASH
ncbi:unnamed protein product, partial [Pylaiella littoralis]